MKVCSAKYLEEQFGGDADIMGEIYGEYVSSIRTKIADADEALAASDWTRLDRTAHTIKGNALAAGDTETAEVAIAIRKAAALCDGSQAAALVGRIKELAEGL